MGSLRGGDSGGILGGHWGGNSLGNPIILHFLCFGPNLRVWTKDDGDEGFGIELRFRAIQPFRFFPDTADACSRFLDEVDTVEQVGNERIAPYARAPQFGRGQSLGQASRTDDLDPVGIDLDKNIGPLEKPIAVHDGVGNRLTQGSHRVLRDILPSEPLDPVCGSGVALDETQGILDVGHNSAGKVLSVQDVDLVRIPRQQTGDVGVRKKPFDVLSEKEHPGIAEKQFLPGTLGRLDVDQHVLDGRRSGNP